jgi:hypothetical protein
MDYKIPEEFENIPEQFENKKYIVLHYSLAGGNAGLNDMKDRFVEFLKISKILNLIPILPNFYLTTSHTNKQNNLLSDYIETPDFVYKELPANAKEEEVFHWHVGTFLPNDKLIINNREQMDVTEIKLEYSKKYENIALDIISQMEKPICVVHIRRGDYLGILGSLHHTTKPENITNILKKYNFKTCYIHTNEKDLSIFDELLYEYNVKFFKDFPVLEKIYYDEGDNYALYTIECCIRDYADIRISTFNTTSAPKTSLPNNDKYYFHDYLDDNTGYQ